MLAVAARRTQAVYAPLGLFPLIVGVITGGAVVLVMRAIQFGHRPTIWLGGLLAACVVISGQHYLAFQQDQQVLAQDPAKYAKLQLVAPERVPPERFWDYMNWSATRGRPVGPYHARGGWAWLAWSVDAFLLLASTLILVVLTARLPYCNTCRRWYQTIRTGRLSGDTAADLIELAGIDSGRQIGAARYRLLACSGGCGPTGLIVSPTDSEKKLRFCITWLDADQCRKIVELLDRDRRSDAEEGPPASPAA